MLGGDGRLRERKAREAFGSYIEGVWRRNYVNKPTSLRPGAEKLIDEGNRGHRDSRYRRTLMSRTALPGGESQFGPTLQTVTLPRNKRRYYCACPAKRSRSTRKKLSEFGYQNLKSSRGWFGWSISVTDEPKGGSEAL